MAEKSKKKKWFGIAAGIFILFGIIGSFMEETPPNATTTKETTTSITNRPEATGFSFSGINQGTSLNEAISIIKNKENFKYLGTTNTIFGNYEFSKYMYYARNIPELKNIRSNIQENEKLSAEVYYNLRKHDFSTIDKIRVAINNPTYYNVYNNNEGSALTVYFSKKYNTPLMLQVYIDKNESVLKPVIENLKSKYNTIKKINSEYDTDFGAYSGVDENGNILLLSDAGYMTNPSCGLYCFQIWFKHNIEDHSGDLVLQHKSIKQKARAASNSNF